MKIESLIQIIDSKNYLYENLDLHEQHNINLWFRVGKNLTEANLTANQIQQIFQGLEQSLTAAGTNRSLIGKAKDTASEVNKAWEKLKTDIQNSKPIENFDQKISDILSKIGVGAADPTFNGQVSSWVQKYRDFAKKHPIAQGAIYATLIAIAGLSGAGIAGAASLGLLKMADKLLQGERFTSAAYQGAKTGAISAAAGKIGQSFSANNAAAADATAGATDRSLGQAGDGNAADATAGATDRSLGQAGDGNAADATAGATDRSLGQAGATDRSLGQAGDGNAANFNNDIPQGIRGYPKFEKAFEIMRTKVEQGTFRGYHQLLSDALRDAGVHPKERRFFEVVLQRWGADGGNYSGSGATLSDKILAKLGHDPDNVPYSSGGSSRTINRPGDFEESQLFEVFSLIEHYYELDRIKQIAGVNEGIGDKLKGFASRVGTNLTTKITADKLMKSWKATGGNTDSEYIKRFLSRQGIDQTVIDNAINSVLSPTPAASTTPSSTPAASTTPSSTPAASTANAPTPNYAQNNYQVTTNQPTQAIPSPANPPKFAPKPKAPTPNYAQNNYQTTTNQPTQTIPRPANPPTFTPKQKPRYKYDSTTGKPVQIAEQDSLNKKTYNFIKYIKG